MEHTEAKSMQCAEKYVLGELSPSERATFEEHYFTCQECAADVRAITTFIAASRKIFRETPASERVRKPGAGWFAWLRPQIAVPVLSVLLLFAGYRAAHPSIRTGEVLQGGAGSPMYSSFLLRGGDRVASEKTLIEVGGEAFVVRFDFLDPKDDKKYESYRSDLVDATGRVLVRYALDASQFQREVSLVVPTNVVKPGEYRLKLYGVRSWSFPKELTQFTIQVASRP